ncbi:hypothetical protein CDIK_0093 [Cucumispora dikerogammari]|nr:hypothetical protein CDIK_0093 [Cucumispora dikerogammari]
MDYTRKWVVRVPEKRNTPRNIEARQLYARILEHITDGNLLFLDETGVNLHHARNYGYSPQNTKCYKTVKADRKTNISCLVAIKLGGVVAHEIKDGAYEGDSFIIFINTYLVPHFVLHPIDILIMNNCRFHHRRDVIALLTANNIAHIFTSAYSPQLNSIEEYFSFFKARLASEMDVTLTRTVLKQKTIEILNIEGVDFSGWFRHMRRFLIKAASRQ